MEKDENLIWEGGFPYDVLAEAGITPASNAGEVLDSLKYFRKRKRLTTEVKAAWEKLRLVKSRLFLDFFLYNVDPGSVVDEEREDEYPG
jgi:hypothetical protein